MTERRNKPPGAIGLELHGWQGIGGHRDLFHGYLILGVVTLYLSSVTLHRLLGKYREARDVLRGRR